MQLRDIPGTSRVRRAFSLLLQMLLKETQVKPAGKILSNME